MFIKKHLKKILIVIVVVIIGLLSAQYLNLGEDLSGSLTTQNEVAQKAYEKAKGKMIAAEIAYENALQIKDQALEERRIAKDKMTAAEIAYEKAKETFKTAAKKANQNPKDKLAQKAYEKAEGKMIAAQKAYKKAKSAYKKADKKVNVAQEARRIAKDKMTAAKKTFEQAARKYEATAEEEDDAAEEAVADNSEDDAEEAVADNSEDDAEEAFADNSEDTAAGEGLRFGPRTPSAPEPEPEAEEAVADNNPDAFEADADAEAEAFDTAAEETSPCPESARYTNNGEGLEFCLFEDLELPAAEDVRSYCHFVADGYMGFSWTETAETGDYSCPEGFRKSTNTRGLGYCLVDFQVPSDDVSAYCHYLDNGYIGYSW